MRIGTFLIVCLALASASLPAGAVPTRADALLLQKAVAALEQSPAVAVHSYLVTTSVQHPAGKPQAVASLQTQARFARASKGRFRCAIWIKQHGRWVTLYETVGDGQKVWTYAALLHQYVVVPEAQYRNPVNLGTHLVKLGLLGALLAGEDTPGNDVLSSTAALAIRQGQSSSVMNHGHRIPVITLGMGRIGTLRLLLDPATDRLQKLDFAGKGAQAHFSVTETVARQTLSPALPASLFHFTPPAGAQPAPAGISDFLP